jgi:8-oxo-dGTP diphosphatase
MSYTYQFPRPALTVDCVVFGLDAQDLKVMLIQRDIPPFQGQWALPGGFVRMDETIDEAATRELREETGIENVFLEQLYTFGDRDRDPRDRTVTVAYYALVNLSAYHIQATTDARLKGKVRYEPIGFELLPKKFTLSQLQRLYETVLGMTLDKRNFRKKILGMGLLIGLDEAEKNVTHRAAQLFEFDEVAYRQLKAKGFNFEI